MLANSNSCFRTPQRGNCQGYTYADGDGTALAALLAGQRVRRTKVGTPVTATDGDDAQLGDDDGGADGGGNLLGGLDAETDVALGVTNDDDGLETRALTGTGLLLDGLDLQLGKITMSAPLFLVRSRLSREMQNYRPVPAQNSHARGSGEFCVCRRTFMTSSLRVGRKLSTIWYSLMGRECR